MSTVQKVDVFALSLICDAAHQQDSLPLADAIAAISVDCAPEYSPLAVLGRLSAAVFVVVAGDRLIITREGLAEVLCFEAEAILIQAEGMLDD